MKHVAALLVGTLLFANPCRAEPPCDFKGIAVGTKMAPAAVMAALGVTKYKLNPTRSVDWKAVKKFGMIPAAELEEWKTGPFCDENSCRIPYGVTVGNNNIPVNVFIAFREDVITDIEVSFNHVFWEEMLPIWDQKYGADWKVDHDSMPITDLETKKIIVLERVSLDHITNGMNRSTNDRCQISATNLDIVFQHHDAHGPYHSVFGIKLISKNF